MCALIGLFIGMSIFAIVIFFIFIIVFLTRRKTRDSSRKARDSSYKSKIKFIPSFPKDDYQHELDLHGLTCDEAIREIQRTIVKNPTWTYIIAIHGYNNGDKLKHLLENGYNIHNRRVIKTEPDPYNKGRTYIYLKQSD